MAPLVVTFTPTGMVPTKAQTPYVPVGPAEIVEQVHEAHEIGITVVLELRPDMASLTLGSLNFIREASVNSPDMIRMQIEKMDRFGVVPELECFDAGRDRLATNALLLDRVHELAAHSERSLPPPAEFRRLGFSSRQRPTRVA